VHPGSLGVAELTGDAAQDVVVAHVGGGLVVLRGIGGGALGAFSSSPIYAPAKAMGIGDLNADGSPDVALVEPSSTGGSGRIEVFAGLRPIPGGVDRYSFDAPPDAKVVRIVRSGASGSTYGSFASSSGDLDVFVRGAAGPMTVDVPAFSTLKPGRAAPAGQRVQWGTIVWGSANQAYTFDNWRFANNHPDSYTETMGVRYIRSP
jgi:hypothetical protein